MKHKATRCQCGGTAVWDYMTGIIARRYLRIVCPECGRKTEWAADMSYLRGRKWRMATEILLKEFEGEGLAL